MYGDGAIAFVIIACLQTQNKSEVYNVYNVYCTLTMSFPEVQLQVLCLLIEL